MQRSLGSRSVAVVLAAAASAFSAGQAEAQDLDAMGSALTAEVSLDVRNRYLFRGYQLDARGAVFQPAIVVGSLLRESPTGVIRELSAGAFAWSSIHAGSRAYPGDLGVFEVDVGLSLDATLRNGIVASLVYTSYLAPTGAFATIHEVGLDVRLAAIGNEDSFAVSPRVLLAQEFYDRGGSEDTYLELGGDVTLPATGPVHWSLPIAVGMSLDGFYRDLTENNVWFGFLGTGLQAAARVVELGLGNAPVSLVAGVDVMFANRDALLTRRSSNDVLWTTRLGVSVTP